MLSIYVVVNFNVLMLVFWCLLKELLFYCFKLFYLINDCSIVLKLFYLRNDCFIVLSYWWARRTMCVCDGGCMCTLKLLLLSIFLVFEQFLGPCFTELLMFYCELYWMFLCKWRAKKQISLHRDNKFVLYCIVNWCGVFAQPIQWLPAGLGLTGATGVPCTSLSSQREREFYSQCPRMSGDILGTNCTKLLILLRAKLIGYKMV